MAVIVKEPEQFIKWLTLPFKIYRDAADERKVLVVPNQYSQSGNEADNFEPN